MANGNANTRLPGPAVNAGNRAGGGGGIDFRRATVERVDTLVAETGSITAGAQRIERVIEGTGYVYGVMLDFVATSVSNTAAVQFAEDAPWNALDTVVYRDVNGELMNLDGYSLFLANLGQANYKNRYLDASADRFNTVPGGAAAGGSFEFYLRIPIALNRRNLRGLVGNQDRSQRYMLRTDVAASGSIYLTAPTTLPTFTINKLYENYSVPLGTAPDGQRQEQVPPDFGTLHFITSFLSEATPASSATVNHYLRRIGNTIRWIAVIFRYSTGPAGANFPRNAVQLVPPSNVRLKVGEDTLFNEPYTYRRARMYEHFGFDWPDGVLMYDTIHDFLPYAGDEVGDDYWQTQGLVNAQFQVSYPSTASAGTVRLVTDDLIYTPPVVG